MIFDRYFLYRAFEIISLGKETNIYTWNYFIFNMDSSDEEVIVMATIALAALQNEPREKSKENFRSHGCKGGLNLDCLIHYCRKWSFE